MYGTQEQDYAQSHTQNHNHAGHGHPQATSKLNAKEALAKQQALHLRERAVSDEIIRLKSSFEAVGRELQDAKLSAEQEFGTSDINLLREKYKEMSARNELELSIFEGNISDAEKLIAQINSELQMLNQNN